MRTRSCEGSARPTVSGWSPCFRRSWRSSTSAPESIQVSATPRIRSSPGGLDVCRPALRLPEGDLAALRRRDHAAPAGWALSGPEQHPGPEPLRPLGHPADLGHRDVGQPEWALGVALDDPAAEPVAE